MRTRIKFCGITTSEAAWAAIDAGADALGFVFYPRSKRHITPEQASKIIRTLPPLIAKVGLFVNATQSEIESTIATAGIDTLQLHGDESPVFCSHFHSRLPVIKALRVQGPETIPQIDSFNTCAQAMLLDAFVAGEHGGTGERFDWELARQAVDSSDLSIILAGGLTPANVRDAVQQVQPYAVDVSSGIESKPGIKDPVLMRAFAEAVYTW